MKRGRRKWQRLGRTTILLRTTHMRSVRRGREEGREGTDEGAGEVDEEVSLGRAKGEVELGERDEAYAPGVNAA